MFYFVYLTFLVFFVSEKNIDEFISVKSKSFFERLKIDDSFLRECPTSWSNNSSFQEAKNKVLSLRVLNNIAERAVKMMQDFHGFITVEEEQNNFYYVAYNNTERFVLIVINKFLKKI